MATAESEGLPHLEIELKFRIDSHDRLRELLVALGAQALGRHAELNLLFDAPAGKLRRAGHTLRIRRLDGGPAGVMAFKGPASFVGAIKSRDEREVRVDDTDAARALLEGLGYTVTLEYGKLREEWRVGDVVVALDELPFGRFCELEGERDAILALAGQLGLGEADAERRSYSTMVTAAKRTELRLSLIESARVGRLATVDTHGRPHVVPVCFVLLDGALYTPIDEKPKRGGELQRVRNLRANPAACLTVDQWDEEWSKLAWQQARGTGTLVEAPDERAPAIAALRVKYPQYRAMRLEERPLIRIAIERIVAWEAT